MTQQKQGGSKNRQAATEAEAQAGENRKPKKSSNDHMSNVKAGSTTGAGGGAKQKQGR
jgi:hypothetical protein